MVYVTMWENRCYKDGIPDEVPIGLIGKGRAPSYKEIAIAILKNDHHLKSLGFSVKESDLVKQLRASRNAAIDKKNSGQVTLFDVLEGKA